MKTQNPWMGRARGSAGNMTSSKVYDKNVMRAKAFEVNNPKTAAQTSERNFFAEAQKVCQTVSEEQLRSLFGVKPKSKSRRNALLSQLLEAFSINNGVKEFDFSKLYAIGNGPKVSMPIETIVDGDNQPNTTITTQVLGSNATETTNLIGVIFDTDNNEIYIFNSPYQATGDFGLYDILEYFNFTGNGFGYVTCDTKGAYVFEQPFGSFAMKTRAV